MYQESLSIQFSDSENSENKNFVSSESNFSPQIFNFHSQNGSDDIVSPTPYNSNNIENSNKPNGDVNIEQDITLPDTPHIKGIAVKAKGHKKVYVDGDNRPQNEKSKEGTMIVFKIILKEYLPKFKVKPLNKIKIIREIENDIHKGFKTIIIVENKVVCKISHDKNFNVNVVKKLKHFVYNKYLLEFCMDLLIQYKLIPQRLKFQRLDHNKIIKEDNRSANLRFLDMTILEFISQNPFNKKILLLFKKNDNNKISIFISNMVVKDYVDIFTFKKELEELDYAKDLGQEKIEEIKKIFKRADTLLNEVFFKSNEKEKKRTAEDDKKSITNNNKAKKKINLFYYSISLFYLLNFRYYYESKKERKKKKKKIFEIKKTTRQAEGNGD